MVDRPDLSTFHRMELLALEAKMFPATAQRNLRQILTLALGEQRRIREARGAIQPRITRGTR